jgi:hypothetical protein
LGWLGENPFNMSGPAYVEFFQQLDTRIAIPIAVTGIVARCWLASRRRFTGLTAVRVIY